VSHDWLPKLLAEIADVAGVDAALALAEARGGTEIYIPRRASEGHWLTDTVGYDAAAAICAWRPAERIMLPLGPRGSMATVRATVSRMLAEGRSTTDIALACGISSRSVERRRAADRRRNDDDRQGRLF
jgi:hypothetical protein